jgi:hypothetical protein
MGGKDGRNCQGPINIQVPFPFADLGNKVGLQHAFPGSDHRVQDPKMLVSANRQRSLIRVSAIWHFGGNGLPLTSFAVGI